jgi:hypothetical protein
VDRGLEQTAFSSGKPRFSHSCAAECGAVRELRSVAEVDDDLQTILDVWPDLEASTRALLIRIVEAELSFAMVIRPKANATAEAR